MEAEVQGIRQLKLLNHGETYVMNSPSLLIRFLPPGLDWVGKVKIQCQQTGLEAELCYLSNSFLGRRGSHSIKGRIYHSSSLNTLYEIEGHWNRYINFHLFHINKYIFEFSLRPNVLLFPFYNFFLFFFFFFQNCYSSFFFFLHYG